jgi:hypothetical protein
MKRENNLLKEAIADAKALHDAMYAEAYETLSESVRPQLSKMIAENLRSYTEGINPSSSGIGSSLTVDDPAPKKPASVANSSSNVPNPGLEIEDVMDETPALREAFGDLEGEEENGATDPTTAPAPAGPTGGAPGLPSAPAPAAPAPVGGVPAAGGPPGGAPDAGLGLDGMAGGGTTPELDLDAIIRELELDIANSEHGTDVGAAPQAMPESFDQVDAGEKVDGAFDGSLKEQAEGVESDGKSPTPVDGVNGGKKVSPGQSVTATGAEKYTTISESWELDEILREMEEDSTPVAETHESLVSENKDLRLAVRERDQVLEFLRTKLQEVNLLNAKLLFTNKLFKGYDLNVNQKIRVVETFERAGTVREVKLVYTTLAESFNGKIGSVSKKNSTTITEGLASKPVGSTAPKSNQTIIAEGTDFRNRLMKLAGINK